MFLLRPCSLFSAVACLWLASSSLGLAAEEQGKKQSLRLHWEPGASFVQRTTTETSAGAARPGSMSMTQTTRLRVTKPKGSDGELKRVEVTFSAISGSLTANGKTMTFDSAKPGEANPALREALGGALKKPFALIYDEKDRFREARELGEMASAPGTLTGLSALADSRAVAHLYRKSLEMGLPSVPVSPGDTWTADETMAFSQAGDVHVDMICKYEAQEQRDGRPHARITFDAKLANMPSDKRPIGSIEIAEGSTMKGTIYYDLERRFVSSGSYTNELKLASGDEVVPMTQRVTTETKAGK